MSEIIKSLFKSGGVLAYDGMDGWVGIALGFGGFLLVLILGNTALKGVIDRSQDIQWVNVFKFIKAIWDTFESLWKKIPWIGEKAAIIDQGFDLVQTFVDSDQIMQGMPLKTKSQRASSTRRR